MKTSFLYFACSLLFLAASSNATEPNHQTSNTVEAIPKWLAGDLIGLCVWTPSVERSFFTFEHGIKIGEIEADSIRIVNVAFGRPIPRTEPMQQLLFDDVIMFFYPTRDYIFLFKRVLTKTNPTAPSAELFLEVHPNDKKEIKKEAAISMFILKKS